MKRYFKRSIAMCLAVLLSLSLCLEGAYALEPEDTSTEPATSAADTSAAEEEANAPGTADGETESASSAEEMSEAEDPVETDTGSSDAEAADHDSDLTDTEEASDSAAEAEGSTEGEETLISYTVVDSPSLSAPDTQEILVGLTGESTPEQAVLTVQNQVTGETASYEAAELTAELALFRIDYTSAQAGSYQLSTIAVTVAGVETVVSFEDLGMDIRYGVDTAVETDPDAVVEDSSDVSSSEETADVVFDVQKLDDANGETELAEDVADALENADEENGISMASLDDAESEISSYAASSNGNVVVTIDPGHDATHAGTSNSSNEAQEYDLTLKIAQYCKEELEQYSGVTVRMTRTSNTCPYSGTTSTQCNANRVADAKAAGSDYYISIHLNSGSDSVRGAEIYYPNANYRSDIGSDGKALAQEIQDQLVALGLKDRGIKIRNSEDRTTYEDGSLADYYGVIRRSKEAGITGIIIEYAFLSSDEEYQQFLSSDEKLKQLGVADATGIATYLGLKKSTDTEITGLTVYQGVDYSAVYDYDYYLNRYPDLKAAYEGNEYGLLQHFVEYGLYEGRRASADFDITAYRNRYPDLRRGYGADLKAICLHYIKYGKNEGRKATDCSEMIGYLTVYKGVDYASVYDYNYYLNHYSDLKAVWEWDEEALL